MRLAAGNLKHRVKFYKELNQKNSFGEESTQLELIFSRKVEIISDIDKRDYVNDREDVNSEFKFRMRYFKSHGEVRKVAFDNVTMEVVSVENVKSENKVLIFTAYSQ